MATKTEPLDLHGGGRDSTKSRENKPKRLAHSMKILGIEFAPLLIPLERRMQTFAVSFWISSFLFMGLAMALLMLYLLVYTRLWFLSIAYFSWLIYDRDTCNRGGRRWQWVREWSIWKHFRNFFPIKLIKTADLPADCNYIFCCHPHGILSAGAFCNFGTEATYFSAMFLGLTPHLVTLEGNYLMPAFRDLFICSGGVSNTKRSLEYVLRQREMGQVLALIIGGAPEALESRPGLQRILLNNRKGFCKIALRHGTSLVPVFSFGETEIYNQVNNPEGSILRRFQNAFQSTLSLAPAIFLGRGIFQYNFGIVPFRKPITTVVGSPIHVDKVENPTGEQIEVLHSVYKEKLTELFNQYRTRFASDPQQQLLIT